MIGGRRGHPASGHQRVFAFVRRSERRRRAFRAAIVAATAAAVVGILAASPQGRHAALVSWHRARWGAMGLVGLAPPREEVEAEWRSRRRLGVAATRASLARTLAEAPTPMARLLRTARMDPETAVIRWGNYDATLVLSGDVFEPDDAGRSYRFRPGVRSVWVIGLSLRGALCQFQVPDTPEARAAAEAAGGRIVPGSVQVTNSWGARGPEPDPDAELRGIVLGDSVIQGVLVGDDESPPARLERELARRTGLRTSVLNAGVLGYSPEQYYYTLERFADRMAPHFIVVGLCGNDFGDWHDPAAWEEGGYWLGRIAQFCRSRQIPHLVVPWPGEDSLLAIRDDSLYPGQVSHVLGFAGDRYFYPIEAFTDEDIRLRQELRDRGEPDVMSPLYNRRLLGDNHLSAIGCALWGRLVAERLHRNLVRQGRLPTRARDRPPREGGYISPSD